MAIVLSDNLNVATNAPVDVKYGPYSGVDEAAAILAANTAIGSGVRYEGLTVGLIIAGADIVEYWYQGGITNGDLVEKTSGGGGDTYTLQADSKVAASVPLKLDAATGTDSTVNFTEGTNITLTRNSATEITIDGASLTTQDEGINIETNTNLINFVGTGVTASSTGVTGVVEVSIPGVTTSSLTHNKMWSGDASNAPIESDILEASNISDSNYFSVIGNADTGFQIGDQPNYINLLTEIYSRQQTTLILGRDNDGAHTMSTTVVIGPGAIETSPASIFGGNVVIGTGAASNHSGVGDYIRNSVIIGYNAGHIAVPAGTYESSYQSTVVGTAAGNRVGNNDVMIGHSAGSNALQKSGSFSQLLIGTATYGCGDGAIVLGGSVSGGIASFNGGIGETMGMSAGPRATTDYYSTIIGYQSTAKNRAITIGYQSQALQNSISIGPNAGGNWDDNNGTDINNIFIGSYAGQGSPTGDAGGDNNVVIGTNAFRYAGYDGKTIPAQPANDADRNIIIGTQSGNVLRSSGNIAIGVYSLQSYYDTHYANYGNIAIGDEAAKDFENEGNLNVFIGSEAATAVLTGTQNVVIGGQAAMSAMASQNVIIGHRAQYDNPTTGLVTGLISRSVIIGEQAVNDAPTEETESVNIGTNSVGYTQNIAVGSGAVGYGLGIALGYNANQRNKGAAGNNSYTHLVSISAATAEGFWNSSKGDANENGNAGNYCFFNNAQAMAAGLKEGDIYVMAEEEGSNTPADPYRLCIVLDITS